MSQGIGGDGQGGLRQACWALCNADKSSGFERNPGKKPIESVDNSPTGSAQKRPRDAAACKGSPSAGGVGGGGGESDHEVHIWTERERRKKMRNMFSNLHALLPQLPAKADKSTIVDEAVNYIRTLQQTLQKLQKQKLERISGVVAPSEEVASLGPMETREAYLADQGKNWAPMSSPTAVSIPRFPLSFQTWSSTNLVLSISGEDAHINICAAKRPGLLTTMCYVLEKHKLEVVTAHVSSDRFRSMYMFHVRATGISDKFPEALMIEDIYKLAVGEMLLWLPS